MGLPRALRDVIPDRFVLWQNFPNPFNPSTMIRYELSREARVVLTVYDLLGREVSLLVNGPRSAGVHEVPFDARGLASGVYLCRLRARPLGDGQAGDFVASRKLLIVR